MPATRLRRYSLVLPIRVIIHKCSATLQIWTKQTGLAYGQVHLYIIIIACRYDICELRDGGAPACDEAEVPRSSVSWCKRRRYCLVQEVRSCVFAESTSR